MSRRPSRLSRGSLSFGPLGFKAGYEVLEGAPTGGLAFVTPLATLHKFQGWADKFLATPASGIEDAYIAVFGNALGFLGLLLAVPIAATLKVLIVEGLNFYRNSDVFQAEHDGS